MNHITITKYLIQTKTENKLESLAAPLLAGLKCRATKKGEEYSTYLESMEVQKCNKIYKKVQNYTNTVPRPQWRNKSWGKLHYLHSPLIYRPTNKEKLMFAIFLEQI